MQLNKNNIFLTPVEFVKDKRKNYNPSIRKNLSK